MSSDRARPDACFVLRFEVSDPHVIHQILSSVPTLKRKRYTCLTSLPGCLAGACAYQTDGTGNRAVLAILLFQFPCEQSAFFPARIGSACLEDCDGESKQQCSARQTHPGIQTRVACSGWHERSAPLSGVVTQTRLEVRFFGSVRFFGFLKIRFLKN